MLRITLHETEIRRAIGLAEGGTRVVDGLAPLGAMEDRCLYFINRTMTDAIRESLATRRDCIVITPPGTAASGRIGDRVILESDSPKLCDY